MTTPRGYPDYSTYPLWRGALLAVGTSSIVLGSPVVAQGYVAQFASLQVYVAPQAILAGCLVTLTWYTDSTLSLAVGSYSAAIFSENILSAVIPNLGNYVQVVIANPSATAQNYTYSIQAVNTPVSKPTYNAIGSFYASHQQNLLSGGMLQKFLPYVVEGNGFLFVKTNNIGVQYDVLVQQVSPSGAVVADLFELIGATTPTTQPFQSGAGTIQLEITNHDAAAQLFDIRCGVISQ